MVRTLFDGAVAALWLLAQVLLATDGFLDNVWPSEISQVSRPHTPRVASVPQVPHKAVSLWTGPSVVAPRYTQNDERGIVLRALQCRNGIHQVYRHYCVPRRAPSVVPDCSAVVLCFGAPIGRPQTHRVAPHRVNHSTAHNPASCCIVLRCGIVAPRTAKSTPRRTDRPTEGSHI